jgi:hypothetical protein
MMPRAGDHERKPSKWEGKAFAAAYAFAVAVSAIVILSSRAEVHSLGAWLVFIVLVACLTAIFALFRKAEREWSWRGGRHTK